MSSFAKLKEIVLTGSSVEDISPLINSVKLEKIYMSSTKIGDISSLVELKRKAGALKYIYMSDTIAASNLFQKMKIKKLREMGVEVHT